MPTHPEYKELWLKAGYKTDMGSLISCRPPPSEFIRVYYLTSADYALSAVSLGRLKVSRLSELNDPFELLALGLKGDRKRQLMRNYKEELNKTHGILCFSGNWTNPVLWSHYGNRHRGICLGFNLRRSKAEQIDYQDERIQQELAGHKHSLHLTEEQKTFLRHTKFRHWEYEQEQRMFVELSGAVKEGPLYFWNFDDDLVLAEIVLGIECRLPLEKVRSLVAPRYPDVVSFNARIAVKGFEIVRDEKTVP